MIATFSTTTFLLVALCVIFVTLLVCAVVLLRALARRAGSSRTSGDTADRQARARGPRPLPVGGGSLGSQPAPLAHPSEELVLPTDRELLSRMGSFTKAIRFRSTLAQMRKAIEDETSLLSAIGRRRQVAVQIAKEARSDVRSAAYEEQLETARLDVDLMKLRRERLEQERDAHAVERQLTKERALLDYEIRAEQRKYEPPPDPGPEPDPVEAEIRKIVAQFTILGSSLREGVKLQQMIEELREELTERFGPETAERILSAALEMAGLGGGPEADPFWFDGGSNKGKQP